MQHIALEFADGFYKSAVLPFSSQRCINLSPRAADNLAYGPQALFSVSGINELLPGGTLNGVCRGMTTMANKLYVVSGTKLYRILSDLTYEELGDVTGTGLVSMANNNTKLCIVVPAGDGYVYDAKTDTFVQITDTGYQPSSTVVFKDGYFVFSASDGTNFFNSKINDPTSFDPLQYGTAEINPDLIVGLIVNHNQLYVLGENTIEVFATVGGTGFPFQRIAGQSVQYGVYSAFTAITFNNDLVWLGGGENYEVSAWGMSGTGQVYNFSTDAIDSAFQKFTKEEIKNNSYAVIYSEQNQNYVAFTLKSENNRIPSITMVYNSTASQKLQKRIWFERQSGAEDSGWRVNAIQEAYNWLVVGDSENSQIGNLDQTIQTEYGVNMIKEFSTKPFSNLNYATSFGMLELRCQTGVGLTSGEGYDPMVYLSFSYDGGNTFGNPMGRSLGKIGQYNHRVQWRRQGLNPQDRCFKFRITDPVQFNVLGLTSLVQGGTQ